MTILFICGREKTYTRNIVILNCIKSNFNVIEIISNLPSYFLRIPIVLLNFFFNFKKYDLIFVGFLGQPLMPVIKILNRKLIVFDAFISLYDTICFDRKICTPNSIIGKVCYWFDKKSCEWSDIVITDTDEHAKYFSETFHIDRNKFNKIYVGVDEQIFHPIQKRNNKNKFTVFYYGTFLPLHGISYIIKAAKLLENNTGIVFLIVGTGPEKNKILNLSAELNLKNIKFIDWIPLKKLPEIIAEADICLGGHFSDIDKAKRVISGKTFQFIAMKKPTIIGDNLATRELFTHKENIYMCEMANEQSLTSAILELYNNKELREKIAYNGFKLFKEKCDLEHIEKDLLKIIKDKFHYSMMNTIKNRKYEWMAGPRYLMRIYLVLKIINKIKPKNILEIGFGSGDLLKILNKKGYYGRGIDFSEESCQNMKNQIKNKKFNFVIENKSDTELFEEKEKFDLVMVFEVLEHIENDEESLKKWNSLLVNDGFLLISVPSHMKKWGDNDDFAGHIRRYEKKELIKKLLDAGFDIVKFYSYGYPIANWAKYFKDYSARNKIKRTISLSNRTKESGKSTVFFRFGKFLFNDICLYPIYLIQNLFLNKDLGTGYLVLARKKTDAKI